MAGQPWVFLRREAYQSFSFSAAIRGSGRISGLFTQNRDFSKGNQNDQADCSCPHAPPPLL